MEMEAAKAHNAALPQPEPAPLPAPDPSNPKDFYGVQKLPVHLVPPGAVAYMAMGLFEGMLKYGRANWRATKVRASVYYAAGMRHRAKWFEGQDKDPLTHVHHLASSLACDAIIVDAMLNGTLIDDRNYRVSAGYDNLDAEVEEVMKHLAQLHKDKDPVQYSRLTQPDPKPHGEATAQAKNKTWHVANWAKEALVDFGSGITTRWLVAVPGSSEYCFCYDAKPESYTRFKVKLGDPKLTASQQEYYPVTHWEDMTNG